MMDEMLSTEVYVSLKYERSVKVPGPLHIAGSLGAPVEWNALSLLPFKVWMSHNHGSA